MSIIFLISLQDNVDYFEFGKNLKFYDSPPPELQLGKIWNVDLLEIVAPPLLGQMS